MLQTGNETKSVAPHLAYLDGLRGLAALYVVLHHAYVEVMLSGRFLAFPIRLSRTLQWLNYGHISVDVFIVLSGYCLMLPLARDSALGKAADPKFLRNFLIRRSRRILPPYYAACLLSLLMIAVIPPLGHAFDARWGLDLPAFTPAVLISHALLIHNLRTTWIYRIDAPLWSVATEWQIYFVFALILIPLWRRCGVLTSAVVAFVLGIVPDYLFPRQLAGAYFHFLGLFGLGMIGATVAWPTSEHTRNLALEFPWTVTGIAALLLTLYRMHYGPYIEDWQMDTTIGVAVICLIVTATRYLATGQGSLPLHVIIGILQSKVCVQLGVFSYSLYLVHWPILGLTHATVLRLSPSAPEDVALMLLGGTALCLVGSYLFHLAFERPFLRKPASRSREEGRGKREETAFSEE